PRPEATSRPAKQPERPKTSMFESLWPKGTRSGRDGQTAIAQIPAPPPAEPEQRAEPSPVVQPPPIPQQPASTPTLTPTATPVSILKSGVVDGMAYTLYSDGSIEAQLAKGTLRFGSITELRNHIEHNS
ncbi:MAG: DUF308 domain-containing protein, partial [Bradyrhizobium sp.]